MAHVVQHDVVLGREVHGTAQQQTRHGKEGCASPFAVDAALLTTPSGVPVRGKSHKLRGPRTVRMTYEIRCRKPTEALGSSGGCTWRPMPRSHASEVGKL
jgi:hypothetical protein